MIFDLLVAVFMGDVAQREDEAYGRVKKGEKFTGANLRWPGVSMLGTGINIVLCVNQLKCVGVLYRCVEAQGRRGCGQEEKEVSFLRLGRL